MELKKQIANQQTSPSQGNTGNAPGSTYQSSAGISDQYLGSHEAVASLLDLRSGFEGNYLRSPSGQVNAPKRLEDVSITHDRVVEIFNLYVGSV